jgi:hypothetical protein
MPDLSIKVDRHEIVVSKPSADFSVIYRREGRTLVADDVMRKADPSAEELILLVRSWKAAFAKAQSLGWLY